MSIYQGNAPLTPVAADQGNYYITEINQNKELKIWMGTCDEYQKLEEVEDNVIYITSDGDPSTNIQNNYMLKSIYDKDNLQMDIYTYINNQLDIRGAASYDAVISNNDGVLNLEQGEYSTVRNKIVNNQPVLILWKEISNISSYSARAAVSTSIENFIVRNVYRSTDWDTGSEYLRIESDVDWCAWTPQNDLNRYWGFGENG